jgi:outer membrane receptor protein involved in Fe transport
MMKRSLVAVFGLAVLAGGLATAQEPPPPPPDQKTEKTEDQTVKREEVVVVSASKVESTLLNAPATMSVITPDILATSPAQNYGDLLRSVPGLNVVQMSARDINMTSRQGTATLANSQLVMLDGRSIYLDFFGLVLWDFVPQSPNEIKQIEVVRGPASAVWGANALTGVVNIITKSPREAEGFGLNLSAGLFSRDGGSREADGSGYSFGGNFSYAHAPSETLAYRLSAGYFNADPYSRPVGSVPRGTHPLDSSVPTGGGVFPPDDPRAGFQNNGTSQPKADLRVDQEFSNGGRAVYQGGYAGTKGIIHTGIGPFDIESGSRLMYGRAAYSKNALKVSAFGNFVDTSAPNLLNIDPNTLQAVRLDFKTETFDIEVGNSNVVAGRHILSYGGNYRRNNFDITLTPNSEDRNELGAYFQDEFFLDKLRVAVGGRVDKFGNIDDAVFSPRVSVMVKPARDHSIRLSFNRAFRSPSVVNNFLDQDIFAPTVVNLSTLQAFLVGPLEPLRPFVASPLRLRVNTFGNPSLKEESIKAYEVAYTGNVGGKTTLGLAVYRNEQDDNINFTNLATLPGGAGLNFGLRFYDVANPVRAITVNPNGSLGQAVQFPAALMGVLAAVPPPTGPIRLPRAVSTYLNLGPIRYDGVEASVEHSFSPEVSGYVNYSYQRTPKVLDPEADQIRYPTVEVGLPAKNRFNAGVSFNTKRWLGSASLNYADRAFWTDVLDAPYFGYTDSYAMVNASLGMKFADGRVIASLKGTNLTNETIQQHVFGDVMKINVSAEVRIFTK